MQVTCRWGLIGVLLLSGGCASVTTAQKRAASGSAKRILVDARYDFGGFLGPGNWYKGGLHVHTTMSDGKLDPLATAQLYRKLGYDFIALTDHIGGFREKNKKTYRPLVYPLEVLNKTDFLVLPGMEYDTSRGGETVHLIVAGPGYDRHLRKGQDLSEALEQWWDNGAFVFLAHPHWSLDGTPVLEDLTFLPAVEVFNYSTAEGEGLRGNSQLYWDRLLRQSRPVLGVATDDTHHAGEDAGGGWVMVKARTLKSEDILKALRSGQFYFSSGPTLHDVFFDTAGNLHVRCSPVAAIRAMSTVGRVVQVKAPPGRTLREAAIKLDPKRWSKSQAPFVRVECVDREGRTAWTQAVLRVSETKTSPPGRCKTQREATRLRHLSEKTLRPFVLPSPAFCFFPKDFHAASHRLPSSGTSLFLLSRVYPNQTVRMPLLTFHEPSDQTHEIRASLTI
jgi:hypothetical protein